MQILLFMHAHFLIDENPFSKKKMTKLMARNPERRMKTGWTWLNLNLFSFALGWFAMSIVSTPFLRLSILKSIYDEAWICLMVPVSNNLEYIITSLCYWVNNHLCRPSINLPCHGAGIFGSKNTTPFLSSNLLMWTSSELSGIWICKANSMSVIHPKNTLLLWITFFSFNVLCYIRNMNRLISPFGMELYRQAW